MKASLIFFFLIIFALSVKGLEKPDYDLCSFMSLRTGIYYDGVDEINDLLIKNNLPIVQSSHVYYAGFDFSANHFPFIFYHLPNIELSLDFRFPFARESGNDSLTTSMNTYSAFFEIIGFHDLKNNISIYPIVGLGASWTSLNINDKLPITNIEYLFQDENNITFSKFNLLLNLGGGMNYRVVFERDAFKMASLVLGLNIRYSLSLDFLGLYDDNWKSSNKAIKEMPGFHAPGLSIELLIGYEIQQNLSKKYD